MTEPVTVSGGADGITANLDDLQVFARLVQSAANSVGDAFETLNSSLFRWSLARYADREPVGAQQIADRLAALVGPSGQLRALNDSLARLVWQILLARASYGRTEQGVVDSLLHAVTGITIGTAQFLGGNPGGGGMRYVSAQPALADLAGLGASALEDWYATEVPDGHAVVADLGMDHRPAAQVPPRDLADLIRGLALRNQGLPGEISVSLVTGADGRRRAIVDVPGTKSWSPVPNQDVTSVGTDIRAMAGRGTSYETGVLTALAAAGVTRQDDVMLVGHSGGGIVAVNAARDAARSGRFRITHIVTAGSPIGHVARDLPEDIQVLSLENSADLVPRLDAAANPDRPDITTVTVDDQHHDVIANHDLSTTYLPAAEAAEHSCSRSVDGFLSSAQGFLDAPTMQTHSFLITRGP